MNIEELKAENKALRDALTKAEKAFDDLSASDDRVDEMLAAACLERDQYRDKLIEHSSVLGDTRRDLDEALNTLGAGVDEVWPEIERRMVPGAWGCWLPDMAVITMRHFKAERDAAVKAFAEVQAERDDAKAKLATQVRMYSKCSLSRDAAVAALADVKDACNYRSCPHCYDAVGIVHRVIPPKE